MIEQNYRVERLNGTPGKHDYCDYFVLDPRHDEHATVALRAYALSIQESDPLLADSLLRWAEVGHA